MLPIAIPSYIMTYTYSNFFSYTGEFYVWQSNIGIASENFVKFNFFNEINLIIILSLALYPYLYIALRAYFNSLPEHLVNTARNLKIVNFNFAFKILLPLSRPAIIGGLFLIIMELLNEYGAVKYFGINTFTVGIFKVWLGMGSLESALNLSIYLFLLVCLLFYIDYLLKGNKLFEFSRSNKSNVIFDMSNKYKVLSFILIFLIAFFAFLLPVFLIIKNSLTLTNYSYYSELGQIIINSFVLSFFTSIIIVIVSIVLIYSNILNNFKLNKLLTRLSTSGYAIPGTVIAISCIAIFSYLDKNFLNDISIIISSTIYILVFALVIRFIAVSFNTINGGFDSLGSQYDKTYRSIGYSPLKSLIKINLPILKPTIISAFILTFVDITKELPLTLILRPFNFDTLATRTFDFAGDEMLKEASLPALVIIIIGVIPIILFNKLKKK